MKRALQALLLVLLSALLLESLLQIGHAIVVYRFSGGVEPEQPAEGLPRILCVGDSFTYGIGAGTAEAAYPATLERLLRDEWGIESEVQNAGWPGQNSFEVWEKLAGQLASRAPSIVSILVGTNDQWQPASRADPAAEARSNAPQFRLEWRTVRLFRLVRAALRARAGSTASRAPVEGNAPGPSPADRPHVLADRVYELVESGRRSDAEELTARIGRLYVENPDRPHADAFMRALSSTGESGVAEDFARALVQDDPDLPFAWQILGWAAVERGDHDEAISAFERLIEQANHPNWRAGAIRALAKVLFIADRDPDRAIRLSLESVLLDDRPDLAVVPLRHSLHPLTVDQLDAAIASLDAGASDRARLRSVVELFASDDLLEIYAHNLERMVDLVQEAGATPLLLTYPQCTESISEVAKRVALTTGARLVDVCSRFREELEARPHEELFIADGHCTAAGYALMARLVAEAVAPILGDAAGAPAAAESSADPARP